MENVQFFNINKREKLCIGRKLENGQKCKGKCASFSDHYCMHHIDVSEVLHQVWVPLLREGFNEFVDNFKDDIRDNLKNDLNKYVSMVVDSFMGNPQLNSEWLYKCLEDEKDNEYLYNRAVTCNGRNFIDGSKCQNNEFYKDKYCRHCQTLKDILHRGYGILKCISPVNLEFSFLEENKIVKRECRTGTLHYVEYCLRRDFEFMFHLYCDLGHRKWMCYSLMPFIFEYPYPEENLRDVDVQFMLRYTKTSKDRSAISGMFL